MASHTLRQRAEFDNMRSAYSREQSYHSAASSIDSYRPRYSGSERSYQTQPTNYSSSPAKRPSIQHHDTCEGRLEWASERYFPDKAPQSSPRASVETYASTLPSEEELALDEQSEYELPAYRVRPCDSGVLPATPSDFSNLFPSHCKLAIGHDDTTSDGNMNLRVDTEINNGGYKRDMTLFHLRMHDLKKREFSLRRYCRDSGREVCHSVSKHEKPATEKKRPGFQRSLTNALNIMRPGSQSKTPTMSSLKRNDSGYASMYSVEPDVEETPADIAPKAPQHLAHTIKLEFSNYAQVDVKRSGVKGNKRYDFEYWGASYAWRRAVKLNGHHKQVSFHLTRAGSDEALAHIVPVALSRSQAQKEHEKGGWIPPCSMWISDEKIIRSQKDVSDVVVSAGLLALVDDAIRERFHHKQAKQALPKVEYIGPKRMIHEMFRRDSSNSNSSQQSRPATRSRPSTSHGGSMSSRAPAGAVRQTSHEY